MKNKIGLAWIKDHFMLDKLNIDTECFAAKISSINKEEAQCHFYPESYQPKDAVVEHLKFALKYESLNLRCLAELFKQAGIDKAIESALVLNPTSKYNRLIGFYYELLTKKSLKVEKLLTHHIREAINCGTSKAAICRTFNVKRTTLYDALRKTETVTV